MATIDGEVGYPLFIRVFYLEASISTAKRTEVFLKDPHRLRDIIFDAGDDDNADGRGIQNRPSPCRCVEALITWNIDFGGLGQPVGEFLGVAPPVTDRSSEPTIGGHAPTSGRYRPGRYSRDDLHLEPSRRRSERERAQIRGERANSHFRDQFLLGSWRRDEQNMTEVPVPLVTGCRTGLNTAHNGDNSKRGRDRG